MGAKLNLVNGRSNQRSGTEKEIGTKVQRLMEMLQCSEGVTIKELASSLQWQAHTVRAALSRLRTDRGLVVVASLEGSGKRRYRVVK
jgi:predicted ArsR family transcriptional regulator